MAWIVKAANTIFWCLLIAVAILLINRIVAVRGHFSVWAYGDAQMLNGGLHFAQEGFLSNHLLPLINPGVPHSLIQNNGPNGRYFHYPSLHAIVAGVVAIGAGASGNGSLDPEQYKRLTQVVFAVASLLGFIALYLTIRSWHHPLTAALAVAPLMLSGWTAEFADSICDQPLSLLFFALNAALLHFRHQIVGTRGKVGLANALIALNVFLAARNSVETPILIAAFNFAAMLLLASSAGLNTFRAILDWVLHVCVPAAVAIGLQFLQSYLEYDDLAQFVAHWSETARTRFALGEISEKELILEYLKQVDPRVAWLGTVTFVVVAGLYLMRLLRTLPGPYAESSASEMALAFAIAFLAAAVFLVLALPRQMMYMVLYARYYLVFAVTLSSALVLNVLVRVAYDSWSGSPRKVSGYLFAVIAFALFALIGMAAQKTVRKGVAAFKIEQSVFGDGQFWAFQRGSRDLLPKMINTGLFERIRATTVPHDFVLYPREALGNSPYEVNPLFEFYTQRHGLPTAQDIALSCELIRTRAPGAGRVFKIVEVNGNAKPDWRLDAVECPAGPEAKRPG